MVCVCNSKRRRSDCRAGKSGKRSGTAFNGQTSKMNKQTLCPQVYLLLESCDSDALYLFPEDIENTLSPDQNHLSTIFPPRYTAADNQPHIDKATSKANHEIGSHLQDHCSRKDIRCLTHGIFKSHSALKNARSSTLAPYLLH